MGQKRSRRRFTREFKQEAVRQVIAESRTQKQVSEELGLNLNVLGRWVKEFRSDPKQSFPGNGHLKARDQEVEALRRENTQLKGELAFLKKVSAYFAKGPR
jgi:transposase